MVATIAGKKHQQQQQQQKRPALVVIMWKPLFSDRSTIRPPKCGFHMITTTAERFSSDCSDSSDHLETSLKAPFNASENIKIFLFVVVEVSFLLYK